MNLRQKITLYLLLTVVLVSVASAQPVHMPDPNLRAAVREALDIADRPDVQLDASILRRHLRGLDARKTAESRTSPAWNTPPPSLPFCFKTTTFPIYARLLRLST